MSINREVFRQDDIEREGSGIVVFKTLGLPIRLAHLKWALVGLTTLVYFLISLGGLVRNAGAGLSCPDWPLCFGHVVPPMNYQVFLEWFHRLIAGSASITLLAVTTVIIANKAWRKSFAKYCAVALTFLAAQVVLGGLTVIGLLNPKWVSSHLAVGEAFFSTLLLLTVAVWRAERRGSMAAVLGKSTAANWGASIFVERAWANTALSLAPLVVFGQIILGGLVSSNYAGLACPDFPTCNGDWFPALQGMVGLQMIHRFGAYATAIVVGVVAYAFWSNRWARVAVVLTAIQIGLGVFTVLDQLPVLGSVAHLATATALLASLWLLRSSEKYDVLSMDEVKSVH